MRAHWNFWKIKISTRTLSHSLVQSASKGTDPDEMFTLRLEMSSIKIFSQDVIGLCCITENCTQTRFKKTTFLLTMPILQMKNFWCHNSNEFWKRSHASVLWTFVTTKLVKPQSGSDSNHRKIFSCVVNCMYTICHKKCECCLCNGTVTHQCISFLLTFELFYVRKEKISKLTVLGTQQLIAEIQNCYWL